MKATREEGRNSVHDLVVIGGSAGALEPLKTIRSSNTANATRGPAGV